MNLSVATDALPIERRHFDGLIMASGSYNLGEKRLPQSAGLRQTLYYDLNFSNRLFAGGVFFGASQNASKGEYIEPEILHNPIVWSDSLVSPADELLIEAALGELAVKRLIELQSLPNGWSFGRGKALCSASKESLIRLIQEGINLPRDPRIFLTKDGGITLVWPNSEGQETILVCLPDRYQFYPESADDEIEFLPYQVDKLAEALGSTHANV